MALTEADARELLTALHDGLYEQPLWNGFLERLRARLGARHAGMMFRPPGFAQGAVARLYAGQPLPGNLAPAHGDGGFAPFAALRPGRVYALAECLEVNDSAQAAPQAATEAELAASGLGMLRVLRVAEPGGASAWLTLARGPPDFTGAQAALLGGLAPHLERALRHYAALERERGRADAASEMLRRLNFGWISLDGASRILELSPQAERLLAHCGELRRDRHGRLVASRPALDRELAAAVRACAGNKAARPRAFAISRDPWVELLVMPARQAQPCATAYIQGDHQALADRHEQLARLFGLLPSEARLALALSRGLTITQAAASLGLTVETARNYSKKIYAKTGARGQADLIRFVLAGVLALGGAE